MAVPNRPPKNALLEAFSPEARTMLLQDLEVLPMPVGSVLFEPESTPKYVHFMTSGMASTVTTMRNGDAVEVSLTGAEGIGEKYHVLGPQAGMTRCFMQVGGSAMRMDFRRFERIFWQDASVRAAVLRLVQFDSLVLAQLCACNRLHDIEERLARWLLMVQDRTGEQEIRLTQEFLGDMLGATRSTVNIAAGALQRRGLIDFRRSHISVERRENLMDVACECYPIIYKLQQGMFRDMPTPNGHVH